MSNALAVDFLGDTLERAGAHRSLAFPGKYQSLKMRPQTGLASLNIEENGAPSGKIAIDFDPFEKSKMLRRRHALTNRLRNMQPEQPAMQPMPQGARQPAAVMMFNRYARNAPQRRALNAQPGTAPAKPTNIAQLRLENAQPKPAKDLAKLRRLEEMPTHGMQFPAEEIRLSPEYFLRMRRQRMMALGY